MKRSLPKPEPRWLLGSQLAALGVIGLLFFLRPAPVDVSVVDFERATPGWVGDHQGEGAQFRAEIPQVVSGCEEPARSALNDSLLAMAEMTLDKAARRPLSQQADAFLKQWREVRDEWPSGASTAHAWERRTAEVLCNDGAILSVRVTTNYYTGGAHSNYSSCVAMFDVRSGRRLTVTDYVGERGLDALAQEVVEGLARQEGEVVRADLLDSVRAFDKVAAVDEGLFFAFDPYEIAGFARGAVEHLVPWPVVHALADRS